METLNDTLFLWLNAPAHPGPWIAALALALADWAIWLIPFVVGVGWLYGGDGTRRAMIVAAVSGGLGLLANQAIGLVWMHPRPFVMGLGHALIAHAPDSSFPSDHLTLWWAVSFSLLAGGGPRWLGGPLALLGVAVAWARIYVGVHFPLDMAGAAAVAAVCAWLARALAGWYLPPVHRLALAIHGRLFRGLIRRGWVRP